MRNIVLGSVAAVATSIVTFSSSAQAIQISFAPGNSIVSPDFSTDFSSLPNSISMAANPAPFDGFLIEQINGETNDIWTTYNPGNGSGRGWYPNGGDNGYTKIQLETGEDFDALSLFVGSGGNRTQLQYQLLDDSNIVASGELTGHTEPFQWLSILGEETLFDTVYLSDSRSSGFSVDDGHFNALALDQINATTSTTTTTTTEVPEPATIFGTILAGYGIYRKRKNKELAITTS